MSKKKKNKNHESSVIRAADNIMRDIGESLRLSIQDEVSNEIRLIGKKSCIAFLERGPSGKAMIVFEVSDDDCETLLQKKFTIEEVLDFTLDVRASGGCGWGVEYIKDCKRAIDSLKAGIKEMQDEIEKEREED